MGVIRAVIGFDGFNGASIEMHVASDGTGHWCTRRVLAAAFDYPFRICGVKVIVGRVPSGNTAALQFDKRVGFELSAIIPDAHPDGALHILTMRREDCRFLGAPNGWKVGTAAASSS